ncbi:hypothetical protein [Ekhidna sp.]
MDDFNFWWYIIAAVIYFFTRKKKKKDQPNSRPGSEKNPPSTQPKSFEDLLKEITEGRSVEDEEDLIIKQEPVVIEDTQEAESISLEGERRSFADAESRKVYEDSIKMAEGADLTFERDEHFATSSLFKGSKDGEEEEWSIADEIRDGLNSSEAKKAVIYSEILTRKY